MKQSLGRQLRHAAMALALAAPVFASAQTTFNISFTDPGAAYSSYYADLTSVITAAGNNWLSYFPSSRPTTDLSISVVFANIQTLAGASAAPVFSSSSNGVDTYTWSTPSKLLTGVDANGSDADALLYVGTSFLKNLWFDPSSTMTVPSDKVDAVSAFEHEFGHIMGFNGWRDGKTGALPGNYQSTFDSFVTLDSSAPGGPTLFFTGANAEAVYGGPVPITYGNYGHIGNTSGRAGSDLLLDLMEGVATQRGYRYGISALDIAMLQDMGLPLTNPVPEPATLQLMLAGLAIALVWRRRSAA